ncbi:MAG TPA: long-chain fatty acid--CoA ligase [Acidimicrobiia bacterium]|nr:long-chain fatty acid--CoA ligase [Acidimicrobiia bacterium]
MTQSSPDLGPASLAAVDSERGAIDLAVEGKTLIDVFNRNARDYPDKPAIHWKEGEAWRHLTWTQYRKAAHEAAAGLISLGVGPSDFVAIMAGNRPEHVIADLGAIHAGGTGVTIYSTLAQSQIQYVAADCGAKVAVLEDLSFMKRWEAIKPQLPALTHVVLMEGAENYDTLDWVLSWDDLIERGRRALASDPGLVERAAASARPEGLATLIYTSGTTGVPKGVMITNRNVVWTAECLRRGAGIADNPRMVSYLPLAHIAERMATHYLGAYLAGEVWYCPDIGLVLEYVQKARPTLFVAVPRVWEKFHNRLQARFSEDPRREKLIRSAVAHGQEMVRAVQAGKTPGMVDRLKSALFERLIFSKVRHGLGMDGLEIAITAAAPISPELIVFFRGLGMPLFELYGMSETTGPATSNLRGEERIGSVGRPLPGVEIALGEDGEIMMRGGVVTAGYYKMPEETAATFDEEGWLHSGDLGRFDEDGFLHLVGRKKEIIINAAGKNIAPAKLETAMKNHPLVAQACMVGDGRQYMTMIIALDPEEAPVWAARKGLKFTDLASFSQQPEVRTELQAELDTANQEVSRVEQVKKFVIVPDVWTPDGGEITPSLKLKRRVVLEKYAHDIDAMYR